MTTSFLSDFCFGGLGVIGLGAYLADQRISPRGVAVIVLGALAIVWGIYTAGFCMSVYGVRWILRSSPERAVPAT